MAPLRYFVVDAFASRPFTGNPAAVVPLQSWPQEEWLQNVAMEMNLSETAYFVPGVTLQGGFKTALFVAVVLGLLNAFLKPILTILTIPITVITLGLFLIVLNVLMVFLTARLVDGFAVKNFIAALLFSLVVSAVTWVMDSIIN